jgi:hypothetical protein
MIDAVIGAILAFTIPQICESFFKHLSEEEKIQCYTILTISSVIILIVHNFWLKDISSQSMEKLSQTLSVVMTSVMIKFVYPLMFIGSQPPVAGSLVLLILIGSLFMSGKWKDVKHVLQQGMTLLGGWLYFMSKYEEFLDPILRAQPYFHIAACFIHVDDRSAIRADPIRFLTWGIFWIWFFCDPINYVYGFGTVFLEYFDLRVLVATAGLVLTVCVLLDPRDFSSGLRSSQDFIKKILPMSLINFCWIIADDFIISSSFPEYQSRVKKLIKAFNIISIYFFFRALKIEDTNLRTKNKSDYML